MKLFIMFTTLAIFAIAHPDIKLVNTEGQFDVCHSNRLHNVFYKARGAADEHIISLSNITEATSIECGLDSTAILIEFGNEADATKWENTLNVFGTLFLTGAARCSDTSSTFLRRVMGASRDGTSLTVKTAEAQYNDIYESASIQFGSTGESCDLLTTEDGPSADKPICIAWNTDCQSNATQQIPLYNSQYASVTCSDCFTGFTADAFVNVEIGMWKLQSLKAGFRNMTMKGGFVLDVASQPNWGTSIDKTFEAVKMPAINFKIGPIPFVINFDMPVEVKAQVQSQAKAQVKVGAYADWNLGDVYVQWTPETHWTHVGLSPKLGWSTVLESTAHFDAQGSLTIIPKPTLKFDKFFQYTLTMDPDINGQVGWSFFKRQLCVDSNYDLAITGDVNLDINIPWANIRDDKTWHQDIYDSGRQTIPEKCIHA